MQDVESRSDEEKIPKLQGIKEGVKLHVGLSARHAQSLSGRRLQWGREGHYNYANATSYGEWLDIIAVVVLSSLNNTRRQAVSDCDAMNVNQ